MTTDHTNNKLTPQEKIQGLKAIVKASTSGMLTTRSQDGSLHSRAMTPASPHSDTQLTLYFIANNVSHKFDEIEHDAHANVSFTDNTGSWASYAGIAKVSRDKDLIHKHWSSTVSAWFGDLKDGVHKGDENDPRVSIIEFVPYEIRYWVQTKGSVGTAISTAVNTAIGKTADVGEMRTISEAEIKLTQGLHSSA